MNKKKQILTHYTPSKNEGVRIFLIVKVQIIKYISTYQTLIHRIHQKRKTRVKQVLSDKSLFSDF